jgi:BirA family biotin operon repressor/biotin-[acetyl-CoA-carboxylase] ligase
MLLRPDGIASGRWSLLPLLVGVGVASGVADVAGLAISLKWPNDLLVEDRKLGGILAERVDTASGPAAVIGCGLNVSVRESELPVPTATSLALADAGCTDRDTVLRAALRGVAALYTRWRDAGGDPNLVLAAYRPLCGTIGREVRVQLPAGRVVEGRAVDVAVDGSLLVETTAGRAAISAGDVVHLR